MPPSNKPATPTDHCMIYCEARTTVGYSPVIPQSNCDSELLLVYIKRGMTFNQFEEPSSAIPCITLSESESSHVDLRPSLSECAAAARTLARPQLQARPMVLTDATYSLLALRCRVCKPQSTHPHR